MIDIIVHFLFSYFVHIYPFLFMNLDYLTSNGNENSRSLRDSLSFCIVFLRLGTMKSLTCFLKLCFLQEGEVDEQSSVSWY